MIGSSGRKLESSGPIAPTETTAVTAEVAQPCVDRAGADEAVTAAKNEGEQQQTTHLLSYRTSHAVP